MVSFDMKLTVFTNFWECLSFNNFNFHKAKLLTSRNGSSSNGMECRVDLIIY